MSGSLPTGLAPFWSLDNISLASNNFTFKKDFRTDDIIDKIEYFLYKGFENWIFPKLLPKANIYIRHRSRNTFGCVGICYLNAFRIPTICFNIWPFIVFFLQGLFTGIIESDCEIPCIKTNPMITEGTRVFMNASEPFISLAFSKTVEVRKTTMDIFSIQESLNFLGSNLGLWPGLGLFQILELFIGMLFGEQIFTKFVKFIKGNRDNM